MIETTHQDPVNEFNRQWHPLPAHQGPGGGARALKFAFFRRAPQRAGAEALRTTHFVPAHVNTRLGRPGYGSASAI